MFDLGTVVPTKSALKQAKAMDVELLAILKRHADCDWPDNTRYQNELNQKALENGSLIIGRYKVKDTIFNLYTNPRIPETTISTNED